MLKLSEINKRLGDFALSGINLSIPEGQYYVLLGRSGSGKTQLLELIAGLEKPDSGSIILDGKDITNNKIQDRKIGIVFQDYAIFPNMTVYGNIAYPLRSRKTDEKKVDKMVLEAARQMNISHLLRRTIENLSGGELQRIALARTLITSPRLLLLDEPLSSLDATLRDEMKRILRRLNREGQTIIHVTHDYSDAVSLADRVGVIHNGRIIQEGKVDDVFNKPVNRFVARYAGIKNFFRLRLQNINGSLKAVTSNNLELKIPGDDVKGDCLAVIKNRELKISIEKPEVDGSNIIKGRVEEIVRSEYGMELTVLAGDIFHTEITCAEFDRLRIAEKDEIWLSFPAESIIILNASQGE
ncbi:MAG: ABC transporter ATP-binding protein [Bacteroidales bacterium]|jgi:ABC-type Fe3+/spermidine/putrescine transport system ATPase subunit